MEEQNKERLLEYLLSFASKNKKELFNKLLPQRTRHITVILEDIFQPQNASAVLRTCDCFGIQDVHIIENQNEYQINPRVVHGASDWLNLYKYDQQQNNTIYCLDRLKERGYKIVATTPHTESVSLHDLSLDQPTALLFGTEKDGLSEIAMNAADDHMYIPMYGFTESFNISVSAAICLHHLTHRMRQSDIEWQLSKEEQLELNLHWVKNALKDPEGLEKRFLEITL
jgi:tRNA (guanosine-2'-O-)-methyltransferase